MQVFLNGESAEIAPDVTAAELIDGQGLAGKRIALEVNGEIVPRSGYGARRFVEGDRIEIVHAIGGG
jgi:sulfur carrier protein